VNDWREMMSTHIKDRDKVALCRAVVGQDVQLESDALSDWRPTRSNFLAPMTRRAAKF